MTRKEYIKEYSLKNKEKIKEYSKQYRLQNIEHLKQYQKEYSLKNKESKRLYNLKNKEKQKQNYLKNKEQIKERSKLYYLNNKKKINEHSKLYRLNNPHIHNALSAKRRAVKLKATPTFANLEKIKSIYKNCPAGYVVDHIVPLQGKTVCGLHVEWNLQYLTPSENLFKLNKFN